MSKLEMRKSARNLPKKQYSYKYNGHYKWVTAYDDPQNFWKELFFDIFCFHAENIEIVNKPKLTAKSIKPVIDEIKKRYGNDTRGLSFYIHDIFYGLVIVEGEEHLSKLYDIFYELDILKYI